MDLATLNDYMKEALEEDRGSDNQQEILRSLIFFIERKGKLSIDQYNLARAVLSEIEAEAER